MNTPSRHSSLEMYSFVTPETAYVFESFENLQSDFRTGFANIHEDFSHREETKRCSWILRARGLALS